MLTGLGFHKTPYDGHGARRAQVVGYPSKSLALVLGDAGARGGVEPVLILRSDSNVEDLAGRATAISGHVGFACMAGLHSKARERMCCHSARCRCRPSAKPRVRHWASHAACAVAGMPAYM